MDIPISMDANWHLRAELSRLLLLLAEHLTRQRQRGRTAAGDVVRGLVVEEGEAEGLITQLTAEWSTTHLEDSAHRQHSHTQLNEVATLAESAARQGAHLPLRHAHQAFELTAVEYHALLIALAAELDARFGRLFAYLNDHVGHTRPTLGLAISLCGPAEDTKHLYPPTIVERPFIHDGLIILEGQGPLPGRALRVSNDISKRLTHNAPLAPSSLGITFFPLETGLLERLVLSDSVYQAVKIWSNHLRDRNDVVSPLLLTGNPGSGRATLAQAAAFEAGKGVISVKLSTENLEDNMRTARRDARWYEAALLLEISDTNIPWLSLWAELEDIGMPVVISLPEKAEHDAAQSASSEINSIWLKEPDTALRKRLWQVLVPSGVNLESDTAGELATAFRFGPGRIAQVIRRALSELSLQPPGERRLTRAALEKAARAVGSASMGTLAQKLPCPYTPEDLVVPSDVQAELDLALAWARGQHKVLAEWGFERRMPFGWGLRALFSGQSGTGKTMAAQVLGRQLNLDLYRVDLSQAVSKFIGETEKNLAQLFDEAHLSGAVLFFDEADALFGKRSEVKDAHDRYANIEIGFLLQRMEEHDGIVVLATNRRQDMDEAFIRRFDIRVDFPMPNEAERLRIWKGMFPKLMEVDKNLNFKLLARNIELSGGEIQNVALASAYLAVDEDKPISMSNLKRALRRELIKSGRVIDESELCALE